jgi:hypothetical protein
LFSGHYREGPVFFASLPTDTGTFETMHRYRSD